MKKTNLEKINDRKIQRKLKREGFLKFLIAITIYPFRYSRRKVYKKMLTLKTAKESFLKIYKENLWSSKESASGVGS